MKCLRGHGREQESTVRASDRKNWTTTRRHPVGRHYRRLTDVTGTGWWPWSSTAELTKQCALETKERKDCTWRRSHFSHDTRRREPTSTLKSNHTHRLGARRRSNGGWQCVWLLVQGDVRNEASCSSVKGKGGKGDARSKHESRSIVAV